MLTLFGNSWHSCLLAAICIQLLASFGQLSAMDMPLGLMHESFNVPKSMDYARRMAFPLEAEADISVEMPPNVEDNSEIATNGDDERSEHQHQHQQLENSVTSKTEMPHWLQPQQAHQHQPEYTFLHNPSPQKPNNMIKHHHSNRQVHTTTMAGASSSPLRRCSIEISSKIPGICQSMGSIGNACISGDYIDVFNMECL